MGTTNFISVTDLCASHKVSIAFVMELREHGLVEIIKRQDVWYVALDELLKVERIFRLYADLDINLEGIEVITQLLQRMEDMQNEMIRLQNRLRIYE